MLRRIVRAVREYFGVREKRYGVRFFSGKYEKLDFGSQFEAENWAKTHLPPVARGLKRGETLDWLVFEYFPVELAIQPSKIRRDEHLTP